MKKNVLKVMTVMAIAVMSLNNVNAANWFVKGDPNTNTTGGTTWATAVTLTKAAASAAAGDIIYLAAGTYTQTAYISLNKAYTVIGGFAGTENESTITPSMSNPTVNVTRLTQAASSTFRIMNIASTTLTGTVTLQDLTFDGLNNNQNGQAIECSSSSLLTTLIKNCKFTNITATATNVSGAININNVSTNVTVQDCWFENITAGNNGGAISTNAKTGNTVTIVGCTFKNTTAPSTTTNYSGGALYANGIITTNAYTLNVDSCTFNGTKAATGGAIYAGVAITLNITNSSFLNCQTANTVTGSGHGGAIIFSSPTVNISNCKFDGCSDNGRGLIYWNAALTHSIIKKSIFTNNTSQGTTQNSGAVFGIQNATSFVTIDSCFAYNNNSTAHTGNLSASVLYSAAGKSNININHSALVGNNGKYNVTRAITFATAATSGDTINIQNSIVSNNTNLAFNNTNLAYNDTTRDITSFSTIYGKVTYSAMIANGEYHNAVSNLSTPATPLKTIYTNLLTTADMSTLTTVSAINDIMSATNALLLKYKVPNALNQPSINKDVFYSQGQLTFSQPVDKATIYTVLGVPVRKLIAVQNASLKDIPEGIYIVNYSLGGKSMSYKFMR